MVQADVHFNFLKQIYENILEVYKDCSDDRRHIHQVQWKQNYKKDVLGEVYLIVEYLEALMNRLILGEDIDINKTVTELREICLFRQENISHWIIDEGKHYPAFLRYIQIIELFRLSLFDYLLPYDASVQLQQGHHDKVHYEKKANPTKIDNNRTPRDEKGPSQ